VRRWSWITTRELRRFASNGRAKLWVKPHAVDLGPKSPRQIEQKVPNIDNRPSPLGQRPRPISVSSGFGPVGAEHLIRVR